MLEEDFKRDEAVSTFVEKTEISQADLEEFLSNWAAHPDYHVEFIGRIIKNLSTLNVQLLNELEQGKRFHLLKALCIVLEVALSMKMWEYMLGREDGAWYWEKHGLYFSSLHALIPPLNELQRHVAELGQGYTGRIIFLEGESELAFLELLHLSTRAAHFDQYYLVYGGKGARQNLVYLIRDKNDKGVRVDLAYDGDSNFNDQCE